MMFFYSCDIKEAKVFEQTELDEMHSIKDGTKRAWPKEYIDARIGHHIDTQVCDHEQAITEDR